MIKLSRLSDYAVVILATLASERGTLFSAAGLSSRTNLPEPTVGKILKALVKQGIIESSRGVHGGYILNKKTNEVTAADIITALDGPIAITDCVEGSEKCCAMESLCPLIDGWEKVNCAIRSALEKVTLEDFMKGCA